MYARKLNKTEKALVGMVILAWLAFWLSSIAIITLIITLTVKAVY